MRAMWHGAVIAESDDTVQVEGNHYFPMGAVDTTLLRSSAATSMCPWKGTAEYFDIVVGDVVNRDAAWTYRDPSRAASQIAGRVAFWRGVRVEPGAASGGR